MNLTLDDLSKMTSLTLESRWVPTEIRIRNCNYGSFEFLFYVNDQFIGVERLSVNSDDKRASSFFSYFLSTILAKFNRALERYAIKEEIRKETEKNS